MKRMLLILAVVMGLTASVSAEQIYFRGTAASANALFSGRLWTMLLTYTPNASGPATFAAATLFFYSNNATNYRNESFNLIAATTEGLTNTITVVQNAGVNNDSLSISSELGPSDLGRGSTAAFINGFTVTGTTDVGNTNGTAANMKALGEIGNSVAGTLTLLPRLSGVSSVIIFTGLVAVPKPGSIALLSGLGLVVGRRLLKRRAKKQETAV